MSTVEIFGAPPHGGGSLARYQMYNFIFLTMRKYPPGFPRDDTFASDKILRTNVTHSFHVMSQLGCTRNAGKFVAARAFHVLSITTGRQTGKTHGFTAICTAIAYARRCVNFFTVTAARVCWFDRANNYVYDSGGITK